MAASTSTDQLRLYLVLPELETPAQLDICREVLGQGVSAVQYRAKSGSIREQTQAASAIGALVKASGALFIVNDRVDLAMASGADGVHLGQKDMPVEEARAIVPPDMILGVSVRTAEEAMRAAAGGADYLGAGTVFPTGSKDDAGEPIMLAGLARVCAATPLPVVAIGGIGLDRVADVIGSGASGIAVISAIASASDRGAASEVMRKVIDAALAEAAQQPPRTV